MPIPAAAIGIGSGIVQDLWQYGLGGQMADDKMGRDKHMMNFQMQKMLEMWQKTGYGPTVEAMKKAGLNPGLLYGMGGAGGQTAQGPTATATMPNVPNNTGMGIQAGLQMAVLQAEKENIEADTKAKLAGIPKTETDIKESQTRIDLNKITQRMALVEAEIKEKTIDAAIVRIQEESNKLASEAGEAANRQEISARTLQDQIDTIVANAQRAIIEKDIAEMMKGKTEAETAKIRQDIANGIKALQQEAEKIKISGGQLEQEKIRTAFDTNIGNRLSMEAVKAIGGIANMYLGKKTTDVNK